MPRGEAGATTSAARADDLKAAARIDELLAHRTRANADFFAAEADRIARLCHRMAGRFARGGRIIALGRSPADHSDVRHVAVEFVHPVIVGKRALPALGLTPSAGPLASQLELLARPADIVIAFGTVDDAPEIAPALAAANGLGCLTIAFDALGAEWEFLPPARDPFIRQELIETLYHIVWELVHVFFEHRGLLEGREEKVRHDAGNSAFLYPFLAEAEVDLETVIADVRASVLMKAQEVGALREATVNAARNELVAGAMMMRRSFERGGRALIFGNGGSSTDAADAAADLRSPPPPLPRRPALDLAEDPAILTALANDIGVDSIFARQIISHANPGDVVLAISTSGSSRNIIEGLRQARRQGLESIALVGYDGGRILAERLADLIVTVPSEHIPRIQEAQASVWHIMRELMEIEGHWAKNT